MTKLKEFALLASVSLSVVALSFFGERWFRALAHAASSVF